MAISIKRKSKIKNKNKSKSKVKSKVSNKAVNQTVNQAVKVYVNSKNKGASKSSKSSKSSNLSNQNMMMMMMNRPASSPVVINQRPFNDNIALENRMLIHNLYSIMGSGSGEKLGGSGSGESRLISNIEPPTAPPTPPISIMGAPAPIEKLKNMRPDLPDAPFVMNDDVLKSVKLKKPNKEERALILPPVKKSSREEVLEEIKKGFEKGTAPFLNNIRRNQKPNNTLPNIRRNQKPNNTLPNIDDLPALALKQEKMTINDNLTRNSRFSNNDDRFTDNDIFSIMAPHPIINNTIGTNTDDVNIISNEDNEILNKHHSNQLFGPSFMERGIMTDNEARPSTDDIGIMTDNEVGPSTDDIGIMTDNEVGPSTDDIGIMTDNEAGPSTDDKETVTDNIKILDLDVLENLKKNKPKKKIYYLRPSTNNKGAEIMKKSSIQVDSYFGNFTDYSNYKFFNSKEDLEKYYNL